MSPRPISMVIMGAALAAFLVLCFQKGKAHLAFKRAPDNVIRLDIQGGAATCSATVVSNSLALTAAHCIPQLDPRQGLIAQLFAIVDSVTHYPISPSYVWSRLDVATLRGQFSDYRPIKWDSSQGLLYAVKEALLCGFPMWSKVKRCVMAPVVGRVGFSVKFDTGLIPGMSGGAVFDDTGSLIGVLHSVDEQGMALASSTAGVLSLDM